MMNKLKEMPIAIWNQEIKEISMILEKCCNHHALEIFNFLTIGAVNQLLLTERLDINNGQFVVVRIDNLSITEQIADFTLYNSTKVALRWSQLNIAEKCEFFKWLYRVVVKCYKPIIQ